MSSSPTAVSSSSIPLSTARRPGPIENWPEYEDALSMRGRPDKLFKWALLRLDRMEAKSPTPRTRQKGRDKGGRDRVYTDSQIRLVLLVQAWCGWSLRATLSFCEVMDKSFGLGLTWPDHSTVSRRARLLDLKGLLRCKRAGKEQWHADTAIDSTGLSARSPGLHRMGRRVNGEVLVRTPVRSSLFVDLATGEVLACSVSPPGEGDPSVVPRLFATLPDGSVGGFSADGAYDTATVYKTALEHGCETILIPPTIREATVMRGNYWNKNTPGSETRKQAVNEIIDYNRAVSMPINCPAGRSDWKKRSGYHRRSLIETAMSRLSRVSNSRLSGRSLEAYAPRLDALCSVLNFHVSTGMPKRQRAWQASP